MSRRESFTCIVNRDGDGRVLSVAVEAASPEGVPRRVEVRSVVAARIAGAMHDILRTGGVNGRAWSGSRSIELAQVTGAQAELLVRAIKPMRRGDRIDQICEAVAAMSREEASYWHAKASQPGGLRALRILLSAGTTR